LEYIQLPKLNIASSILAARSNNFNRLWSDRGRPNYALSWHCPGSRPPSFEIRRPGRVT